MTARTRTERLRPKGTLGQSALTPLLDTLFLLLFALLASSRRASLEPTAPTPEEVRVELPAVDPLANASAADGPELRLIVRVDSDQAVSLVGHGEQRPTVTTGELRAALEDAAGTAAGRVVVEIRADASARHGLTVDVLQTVRAAGIVDVRFVATSGLEGGDGRRLGGAGEGPR